MARPAGRRRPCARQRSTAQAAQSPPPGCGSPSPALADALTTVFTYAAPIMAVAFLLTWLLREVPMRSQRTTAPDTARELSAAAAPGTAEPDAARA